MRCGAAALLLSLLVPAAGCARVAEVSRVVIVTFDTTRADRIGAYGYADAQTPNLDAVARQGVLYEQAVSSVPTTMPSHATMFTGVYPQDHGVRYNLFYKLGSKSVTLAEMLKAEGFATAAFPATQILDSQFGLDQGFDVYDDPQGPNQKDTEQPVANVMRSAGEGVDLALEWLADNEKGRSFLWLHFYDPHHPYAPTFPYSAEFRERPYDGEIAYTDTQFGRLLGALEDSDHWDSTLLIVAGDHGEGLYDHKERWHTMLLYETTQRVPLIIRAPGVAPARVAEPVGLVDITPTVLDLAGIPTEQPMRGVSLRPSLVGAAMPRRDIYFETHAGSIVYGWARLAGLRSGRWKLIDSDDPELFDLDADPDELTNLASLEAQRVSELREELELIAQPLDAEAAAEPEQLEIDPETEALFRSLGYTGGDSGRSTVDREPHPRDLIDMEPELLAAQSAVAMRDWVYLVDLCDYALKRDPTNKWGLVQMSTALLHLNQIDDALKHAQLARKFYPDSEPGYKALADVYMGQKKYADAYALLREALDKKPGSMQLRMLSLFASFEAGRETTCSEDVPEALTRHAEIPGFTVFRARCEAREGETLAALESLRAAVELGFRGLNQLEESADFEAVVATAEFRELATSAAESPRPGL